MDKTVYARPYAKAIFETALKNNALQQWSEILANFARVATEKIFIDFIDSPLVSHLQKENLLADVAEKFIGNAGKNLMQILVENQRLDLFAELATSYEQLRTEYENIVQVEAVVAYTLTAEQKIKLETALQKRLQKKILLCYKIDKELLGGMIIYIGDNIIDGSLRNKLNRLKKELLLN
jgi:F-type H+-transporting ATPase subunit delta